MAIDKTPEEQAEEHAMASVIESAEGSMPTYEEALKCPDWPKWEDAISKELESLKASGTYQLVERPPGANVVGLKWVLRIKKNSAGEVEKYKARLVARGFTQIYGVDYYKHMHLWQDLRHSEFFLLSQHVTIGPSIHSTLIQPFLTVNLRRTKSFTSSSHPDMRPRILSTGYGGYGKHCMA